MKEMAVHWGVVLLFVGGILLTQAPVVNPDALEMGLVGQGFLGEPAPGLDPYYYPPVFPFLSACLSVVLPLPAAILLIGPLAIGALFFALLGLLEASERRVMTGLLLVGVLWSSASLRDIAVGAEPRVLQLAFLFGGIGVVLAPWARWRGVVLGLLAALLVLTRPEGFLFAGLLLGAAVLHWRRKSLWSFAACFGLVIPYLLAVSRAVGGLSLNSRAWEIKGAGLLELLPVRPLVQLWGTGAESTPFREALRGLGPQTAAPQENVFGALGAASIELGASVAWVLWPALIWGAWLLWCRRRFQFLLLTGILLASMALYLVPMGRDLALPLNNLLPAVVALHVWVVVGLSDALSRANQFSRAAAGVVLSGVLLFGVWGLWSGSSHAPSESVPSASSWIRQNLPVKARVASSFGSSPIVHLADRAWARIPSRWERASGWEEPEERPDFAVLTSTDGLWMLGPPGLHFRDSKAKPIAFFRDSETWVLILDFREPLRAGEFD